MRCDFTAVYVDGEEGWIVGYLEEWPGVAGQGRTLEETRESLHGALDFALTCNRHETRKAFGDARVILRERMTV